jgi:RNA polymerase sigma factor (sigma-70 family)
MAESGTINASAHDLELVALAASGSCACFGELIRRHGPAVRGLVRRMGADPALADDVAQDAFLAAFEQIGDFRGEGTFQAWLKRIAARLYVKRWRRDARMRDEPADLDPAAHHLGEAETLARIDLDAALQFISDAERVCVTLCYGAGLSHAEAAQVLNTPLGTVKSHVKRGLDKLRRRLAAGRSFGPDEVEVHG